MDVIIYPPLFMRSVCDFLQFIGHTFTSANEKVARVPFSHAQLRLLIN